MSSRSLMVYYVMIQKKKKENLVCSIYKMVTRWDVVKFASEKRVGIGRRKGNKKGNDSTKNV